jgi:hypothetical protein
VFRGGYWDASGGLCGAATRVSHVPWFRNEHVGFRVALAVDAVKGAVKARAPSNGGGEVRPFTDSDVTRIAALPAADQVEEVRKELMRRNPGFDTALTPTIENDAVTGLEFFTDRVTDIAPVRALRHLTALGCRGRAPGRGALADLRPLSGMPLQKLDCGVTSVSDLTPLRGMPLTHLHVDYTPVSDLTPLTGMSLKALNCSHTQVSDLKPLGGMPLNCLWCNHTAIDDLSPLKGMPLEWITIQGTKVSDLFPLKGMPLTQIYLDYEPRRDRAILRPFESLRKLNDKPAAEFWKDVEP